MILPLSSDIVVFCIFAKENDENRQVVVGAAEGFASAVAAVDYGADASISTVRNSARGRPRKLNGEIARVAGMPHRFGVGVHATLNTLLG